MLTLGQRLRKARKLRDLTQAELTKKSGASQQLLSRIENEKVESTTEIFNLADALNVNPRWLATGTGDMEPIKMTASDANEEEMQFIHMLRGLTSEQRKNVLQKLVNLKRENELVIKELGGINP